MMKDSAEQSRCVDLYLELLKGVLTDTIYGSEPDLAGSSPTRFMSDFIEHYIRGRAISMLPVARLNNIQSCVDAALKNNIKGDLIETGVWRGGAVIFMRAMLEARGVTDRLVWAADSFEGLPEPDAEKYPLEAKAYHGIVQTKIMNHLAASIDEVRDNFAKFHLLDDQVRFLKGWFKDTLPSAPVQQLAILRLDGDHYEFTMDALTALYHRLSPGGFAIIDDYGEDTWTYCRQAVDEFRANNGIDEPLIRVDPSCFFWQRRQ